MPQPSFNKLTRQGKLTTSEIIQEVCQLTKLFAGSLAISVTQEANEVLYCLQPAARYFNVNYLRWLVYTSRTLLLRVRQISFGSTPYGIANNGIRVAGQALEILPNHQVKRIDRGTGKKVDCEIIISTTSTELDPAAFQRRLCRVLRVLAQNPSRHLEDLPFKWTWVNHHPFRRNLTCIEVQITGITDFTIVLEIYPDSGRSVPLNCNDKRKITKSITATMEQLMSLKRLRSTKQPLVTLPVEIIAAIVEYLLPERLDIFPSRRLPDRRGTAEYDAILRPGKLALKVGHVDCFFKKKPDLMIFNLNKRIRQIAIERARHRTPIHLSSYSMDACFKQNLKLLESAFGGQHFSQVRRCTCWVKLVNDVVTKKVPGSSLAVLRDAIKFSASSKWIFRNIRDLLKIRIHGTGDLRYHFIEMSEDRYVTAWDMEYIYTPGSSTKRIAQFVIVFDIGGMRTDVAIVVESSDMDIVFSSTPAKENIRELYSSSLDTFYAPLLQEFAKEHDLEYLGRDEPIEEGKSSVQEAER